jgi:hypothetical protein
MSKKNDVRRSGSDFFDHVVRIIEQARNYVGRTADLTMCVTYFEVGRMIVEEEQGGKSRAEYGKSLLKELSAYLGKHIGKGFSESNLRNARKFYQTYAPEIQQFPTAELEGDSKNQIQQLITAESGDFEFSALNKALTGFFKISGDSRNNH